MNRPPRRSRPQRPALQPALLDRGAVPAANQAADAIASDPQAGIEELLQQFESMLREDPGIDSETREFIRQQFGQALSDAASAPDLLAAAPDRADWMDAVQGLRQSGAMSEDEANTLVRQLDQALQPLQRRESQLAIEFSRRMQAEGQEKALEWFRQESRKVATESEEQSASPPPPSEVRQSLSSEVVNSRSRRLRGPPRMG